MDRSEGAEPKGREADLFQARDGGKPRVAQPPQRDQEARSRHSVIPKRGHKIMKNHKTLRKPAT